MATRRSGVPVAGPGLLDAPTSGDHRRIRNARRHARARNREIDVERDAAVLEAFRAEIGTAVRSASPLLISLLAIEGVMLDDAVGTLGPRAGWPARPRLSGSKALPPIPHHLFRQYMMARQSQFSSRGPTQITQHPLLSSRFERAEGGHMTLNVVDHSLEVEARIGPALIETRFGSSASSSTSTFRRPCSPPASVACSRKSSTTRRGGGAAGGSRRPPRRNTRWVGGCSR